MIRVEDLRFRYAGQQQDALQGLSFDFAPATLNLVSGPTGCAKTTLALCLCGALPQLLGGRLTGRIAVGGNLLQGRAVREVVRDVGLLMQNVEWQIVADRVADEVAFSLENFAVPPEEMDARIAESLRLAGADQLGHRRLRSLSAGERQRVVLAALLCLGQQVLILDEPLAYLDRRAAVRLMRHLAQLARDGRTVLVFEHRRDLVRPIADAELRLEKGRAAESATDPGTLPSLASPPRLGPPRVTWEEVRFDLPERPLLRGLSLQLLAGESVVLLGDNGCGKTTLLRSALGRVPATSGSLRTGSLAVAGSSTRALARHAALVLQNPDHQLHLPTVGEEIRAGGVSQRAMQEELKALGLTDLVARHPHSLSTGQKRRVTIAAALARRPHALLLDEPTVGQDDENLARIVRRLDQFVQQGGALLVATHDARAARALAHRIVLLQEGTARHGGLELLDEYFADQCRWIDQLCPPSRDGQPHRFAQQKF